MSCDNSYKLAQKISISGKTTDGKLVLKNAFIFMSTIGLPMNILIEELNRRNIVIDWLDFCECALKANWNKITIYNKIKEGVEDVYSKDYCTSLLYRIKLVLEGKIK